MGALRPPDGSKAERFAVAAAMHLFSARGPAMKLNQKIAARIHPPFFSLHQAIESLKPKL